MILLEKWKILTPLQKLPTTVGNLGKIIVATGFEKLPKVEYISQSGHTGQEPNKRASEPASQSVGPIKK